MQIVTVFVAVLFLVFLTITVDGAGASAGTGTGAARGDSSLTRRPESSDRSAASDGSREAPLVASVQHKSATSSSPYVGGTRSPPLLCSNNYIISCQPSMQPAPCLSAPPSIAYHPPNLGSTATAADRNSADRNTEDRNTADRYAADRNSADRNAAYVPAPVPAYSHNYPTYRLPQWLSFNRWNAY